MMAKNYRKYQLKRDYSSWWQVAGDVYGNLPGLNRVSAQRYFDILESMNSGTSLTRGSYIRVPFIDPSKPKYLSHSQVAAARGQYDYGSGPTQDYWDAVADYRNAVNQGLAAQPPTATTTTTTGDLSTPPDFTLPDVRTQRKRPDYDPERARYTPSMEDRMIPGEAMQLPEEYYEYFYPGRAENRMRQQMARDRARDRRLDARRGTLLTPSQRAQAARQRSSYLQPAEEQPSTLNQRQYDTRFGRQPQPPRQRDPAFEPLYRAGETILDALGRGLRPLIEMSGFDPSLRQADLEAIAELPNHPYYERARQELNRQTTTPQEEEQAGRTTGGAVQGPIPEGVQSPYTTEWLYSWLSENDPDATDDVTAYMLRIVGFLEPTDYSAVSTGGGYGGGYYGARIGRPRGGRRPVPSYGTRPSYSYRPTQSVGNMGLVSWRI